MPSRSRGGKDRWGRSVAVRERRRRLSTISEQGILWPTLRTGFHLGRVGGHRGGTPLSRRESDLNDARSAVQVECVPVDEVPDELAATKADLASQAQAAAARERAEELRGGLADVRSALPRLKTNGAMTDRPIDCASGPRRAAPEELEDIALIVEAQYVHDPCCPFSRAVTGGLIRPLGWGYRPTIRQMTPMMSLPLSALRLSYRIARLPLRLAEDFTTSERVGMLSYRCDRIAARVLRDESLLIVDHDCSGVIRLHEYRDRLNHRRDTQ